MKLTRRDFKTYIYMLFIILLIMLLIPDKWKLDLAMSNHKSILFCFSSFFVQADIWQFICTILFVSVFSCNIWQITKSYYLRQFCSIIFVVGGLLVNASAYIIFRNLHMPFQIIGSSGGVLCLFGCLMMIFINHWKLLKNKVKLKNIFIILIVICLYLDPGMLNSSLGQISFIVHLIGLLYGILFGIIYCKKKEALMFN